jgi:hypothetical protein
MNVIESESIVFVDVDDTLIMWSGTHTSTIPNDLLVKVQDPYSPTVISLIKHIGHIKILKDRKARGACIIVWSAGGYRWAEAVVKALALEASVDMIMSKPIMYIDDSPSEEFMGPRVYLGKDSVYGS